MKKLFLLLILAINSISLFAFNLGYTGHKSYTFVERTDLRRYDNGKYIGLLSREIKAFILPTDSKQGYLYDGNFYVNQDTRRGVSYVNPGLHDAIPSVFNISDDGKLTMLEDYGYPSFRSFPSFPQKEIVPGESWEAYAERAVDPLDKGIFTKMPMYIRYTYLRDEVFHDEEVLLLSAKWATRYGASAKIIDIEGDSQLVSAAGNHSATIYVSKKTGNALVVRDSVEETFSYNDGNKITFKGTISLFTEYPPTINEEEIIPIVEKTEGLNVEKTTAGLKLTMTDLKFKPNSSQLLEGEKVRLSQLADLLKKAPKSQFLVEGHTASVGNPNGEMELSIERAHAIVKELVKLGIPADSFVCKGLGSTRPIADNSTPEGKAKNRRVEITILE